MQHPDEELYELEPEPPHACEVCGKMNALPCPACMRVYYCSVPCQFKHIAEHMPNCHSRPRYRAPPARCAVCPNQGVFPCGNCQNIRYCGPDCQRKHCAAHRLACRVDHELLYLLNPV